MTLAFVLPLKLLWLGLFMTLAFVLLPKLLWLGQFMTPVFVLPLKLRWLVRSVYDSGFCAATEIGVVTEVYL